MATITRAVGKGVPNFNRNDVMLVQRLLNEHRPASLPAISDDGIVGPETIAAIEEFQRRVVKMPRPDGRVDPDGTTLKKLSEGHERLAVPPAGSQLSTSSGYYWHPDANTVTLNYGENAVQLNPLAEQLLKSILASCDLPGATLTSTLRTYHDQARITMTQTYKNDPDTVSEWYGADVLKACEDNMNDIDAFAKWWHDYDEKRGKVSSKHLSNHAMDVVPTGDRNKFVAKVQDLVPVAGSGVKRIIKKGQMHEPVDHVEFTFEVTG